MLTVVINAGGESRRMGQDKALMTFLGRPVIERILQRVAKIADEVWVTTNRPADYAFLGIPLASDVLPGRGALGGLYTALSAAQNPLVAVIACDMPFASTALLQAECDALMASGADVAIPNPLSGLEPFHAVYRRATCRLPIEAALRAGKWRADAWFPQVKLRVFTPVEIARYDPEGLAFFNINTPAELLQAEELARR